MTIAALYARVSTDEQAEHGYSIDAQRDACREAAKRELRGHDLACWCKPGDPCHADILLRIANE